MSIFSLSILCGYCGVELAAKSIVLIGMMGAGKSSVGRCLQRRTGLELFETDEAVSRKFGLSIPEIFAQFGEEKFRQAETDVLREFAPLKVAIVVTGGGTILREENIDLLQRLGFVVWLDADEATLFARATRRGHRPLLQTENPRARLESLLREREALYKRAADLRIDTSTISHEEVADAILSQIEELSPTR
jgi:shikimate kinase